MYVAAGITEMWILVGLHELEVATDPGPDGYRILRHAGRRPHHPLAFPDLTLAAADLVG